MILLAICPLISSFCSLVFNTISYAENIDVIPTIAHALGIEAPSPGAGSGRVLKSIFIDEPKTSDAPQRMLRFNQQIKEYLLLTAKLRLQSIEHPHIDNLLMRSQNALTDNPLPFLGIDQIDRWYQAGSFDKLLERNEAALKYLQQTNQ